ncbi:MAG: 4-alpha-glucanotransferase [Gammaproteobacteria bacterium]|nr:4-alpha-glucanotransferase [Gammaproteobacteria bacterium]
MLNHRRAGVLLHITSIPAAYGNGYLGQEAKNFIDFLANSKISVWQMLPLGPTHHHGSPYQTLSVHANNALFIDLPWLMEKGWLSAQSLEPQFELTTENTESFRKQILTDAYTGFIQSALPHDKAGFVQYKQDHREWLDDYALFMTLHDEFSGLEWNQWPDEYRHRHDKSIESAQHTFRKEIDRYCFEQFVFNVQWQELRQYASSKNVYLVGDMPIFVAFNSDAVWANQELFELNADGSARVVAGVPPDYFSDTGQLWGNPLYSWESMKNDGFQWWISRLQSQLELFDCIRFDHFRALESYWEIPAGSETAVHGNWVKAPGEELLLAFIQRFGLLPLIAEDLGIITEEVEALRDQFDLPGMKVLQFAFGGGADNIHLSHNHIPNSVVYTGTHDNDTSAGWYASLDEWTRSYVDNYLSSTEQDPAWTLIREAMSSVSQLAVIPMQDILSLPSEERMNTPGTVDNNWQWQLSWDQVDDEHCRQLGNLVDLYGRAA